MPRGSRTERLAWIGRQLRDVRPDVIWVQEEPVDPFLLEMLALYRFRRGPRIVTAVCESIFPRPSRFAVRAARRLLWPRLDHLMAVAQPSLQGIRAAGMPYSVPASTLVAGGLEPEGQVAAIPLPDADSGFTVGFAGRLIEAKGWKVLVRALPEGARLVLAGDGPQRGELEALAAEDGRLRYVGLKPKEELWSFYAALDCLAVPSLTTPRWKEQSASTLVDGLAMGLPIVASDSGGIADIMGPAGLLVPEGDAHALRNALARVRDDPALRESLATAAPRALPPRVRHPGLCGEDCDRAESSRALGSLANVSVLEKTAPEDTSAEEFVPDERITTIRPATRMPHFDLRELWRFRELASTFVWRDIKVRYKQTFIGVLWVVLQPLLTTVIFTLIFGRFADFPSDGLPYPVFVMAGVLPWTYFATSLSSSSGSIAGNRALVTRVYFPRLLLPLGSIATPLVDFFVAFPVLVGMIFWFDLSLGVEALLAPLFLLLAAGTALGVGLVFAVGNVRYRDVPSQFRS